MRVTQAVSSETFFACVRHPNGLSCANLPKRPNASDCKILGNSKPSAETDAEVLIYLAPA